MSRHSAPPGPFFDRTEDIKSGPIFCNWVGCLLRTNLQGSSLPGLHNPLSAHPTKKREAARQITYETGAFGHSRMEVSWFSGTWADQGAWSEIKVRCDQCNMGIADLDDLQGRPDQRSGPDWLPNNPTQVSADHFRAISASVAGWRAAQRSEEVRPKDGLTARPGLHR